MSSKRDKKKFFEDFYSSQTPPWEIGRPQTAFVNLIESGELLSGKVLDLGCGTGELTVYLAEKGYDVFGVDFVETAIQQAKEKLSEKKLKASLFQGDVLDLSFLKDKFQTVIDCGLFHVFSDEEREIYLESIDSVLEKNGSYYLLCFSEHEIREGGPRRLSENEIRTLFGKRWRLEKIAPSLFETYQLHEGGSQSWLAHFKKS